MPGFYQDRNVRSSCSYFLSFLAHIKQSSPRMVFGGNQRFSSCRGRRLFPRFLRLLGSYDNLSEFHLLTPAPDGHGAIGIFLHHQLLRCYGLLDLIELPVMGNGKVIAYGPFRLDAEDPLEVQPLGYRSMEVFCLGCLPGKPPVIDRQILHQKRICLSDAAYPLSLISLTRRS